MTDFKKQIPHTCAKCGKGIPRMVTHLAVQFQFFNKAGPDEQRRFCMECCADPACAVLFSDVLTQPLAEVRIRKVW